MTRLSLITVAVVAAGVVRQAFVLSGVVRSRRFLHHGPPPSSQSDPGTPMFFLVVPVLREAAILAETVAHLRMLTCGHAATVVVVTTAREVSESMQHADAEDTVTLARELARAGGCVHLHYSGALGVKADQLNYATARCAAMVPDGVTSSQAFLVCYDADSRPPRDSLAYFAQAIAKNPEADVFHQSSRFELRGRRGQPAGMRGQPAGILSRLQTAVCDAGALRANRFVLGFEIPRLVSGCGQVSTFKQKLCSTVYAHVTGHGLCVRLSCLQTLPFPACSPLEDMHYSFILGTRGLPMIAVPSLDVAEVPAAVRSQIWQAARWFFGPAQFVRYLKNPASVGGWRSRLLAASAFGSAAEWVGCAVVPPLICVLITFGDPAVRIAATCYAAVCAAQVILTETWLGAPGPLGDHLRRIGGFPLACMVHGIGGILGCAWLAAGKTGAGKTERGLSR